MQNQTLSLPLNYGKRLIPTLIDELATRDATRVFLSLPRTANIKDGFEDITYEDLAHAINVCAWWMECTLQRSETFETLNYVGPQDLRYVILLFAAIKTGYQVCAQPQDRLFCLLCSSFSARPRTALKGTSHCSIPYSATRFWSPRSYRLSFRKSCQNANYTLCQYRVYRTCVRPVRCQHIHTSKLLLRPDKTRSSYCIPLGLRVFQSQWY